MNTNIETTPKPVAHDACATETHERATELTKNLLDLGTIWARYGLGVGKSALETSARSLQATAKILGGLAETLAAASEPAKPEGDAPKAEAKNEPPAAKA